MELHHPSELAARVAERWGSFIGGEWIPPVCPPSNTLGRILEIANFASGTPEEGRFPSFNVVVYPAEEEHARIWRFDHPRELNVAELRRLIPATDIKKSAIALEWDGDDVQVVGLLDLGTSWHRARTGLTYHFDVPHSLLIEVERPNRMHVYQGQFRIGSLVDGRAEVGQGPELHSALSEAADSALHELQDRLVRPELEHFRYASDFEFLAMLNTYTSIANTVVQSGHGGALLIIPETDLNEEELRIKYQLDETQLQDALVAFINARHRSADEHEKAEDAADSAEELTADQRAESAVVTLNLLRAYPNNP